MNKLLVIGDNTEAALDKIREELPQVEIEPVLAGPGEPYSESAFFTKRSGGLLLPFILGATETFRLFTKRIYRTRTDVTPPEIAITLRQKAEEKRIRKAQKRIKGGRHGQ